MVIIIIIMFIKTNKEGKVNRSGRLALGNIPGRPIFSKYRNLSSSIKGEEIQLFRPYEKLALSGVSLNYSGISRPVSNVHV
jgi:hypothetical protein